MKPVPAEAPVSPGSPRKKTIAAGPKKSAPRSVKAKAEPSRLDAMQKLIVTSLEDDKAENVVTLDLTGKAMFCDRMVIASGLADRQITAMAQQTVNRPLKLNLAVEAKQFTGAAPVVRG